MRCVFAEIQKGVAAGRDEGGWAAAACWGRSDVQVQELEIRAAQARRSLQHSLSRRRIVPVVDVSLLVFTP